MTYSFMPSSAWRGAFVGTALAALLFSPSAAAQTQLATPLLYEDLVQVDPLEGQLRDVLRSRTVRVDVDLLARVVPGDTLRIDLFEDLSYEALFQRREPILDGLGGLHWHGTLVGKPASTFVITVYGDRVAAWFHPGDREHGLAIQPAPGTHCVREVDARATTCGAGALATRLIQEGGTDAAGHDHGHHASGVCDDNPDLIRVLLPYDTLAEIQAGGPVGMTAVCLNAINQANEVCGFTGLQMRFESAGVVATGDYVPSTMGQLLNYVTNRQGANDPLGLFDIVHGERETRNADLVALIVGNDVVHGTVSGIAWSSPQAPAFGFSVTEFTSFPNMTLAHELGHNFGCFHNREDMSARHPYAHGHWALSDETGFPIFDRGYFYTVMSYAPPGDCSFPWTCRKNRIPFFSRPGLFVDLGNNVVVELGTPTRDNARRIRDNKQTVANYSLRINGFSDPPVVTQEPQDLDLHLGYNDPGQVTLTVATDQDGRPEVSYQWFRNGTAIPGATSRGHVVITRSVTSSDVADYTCRITSPCGTISTRAARVRVDTARQLREIRPSNGSDRFGGRVANVGDVNGDGYDDYAIVGQISTNNGFIEVFSGRDDSRLLRYQGGTGDFLGAALSGAGDMNADGLDDIVVSLQAKGEVRLLRGGDFAWIHTWRGNRFASWGRRMAAGRDLDAGDQLTVHLFDDASYTARFARRELFEGDCPGFHWHGSLVAAPGSQFIVTVVGQAVAGWFHDPARDDSIIIQPAPGTTCVREFDGDHKQCGADHLHGPLGGVDLYDGGGAPQAAGTCNDDPGVIDVLFAYDDLAVSQTGIVGGVQAVTLNALAHAEDVVSVAWSPDGEALASASDDGVVRVWALDHETELAPGAIGARTRSCRA